MCTPSIQCRGTSTVAFRVPQGQLPQARQRMEWVDEAVICSGARLATCPLPSTLWRLLVADLKSLRPPPESGVIWRGYRRRANDGRGRRSWNLACQNHVKVGYCHHLGHIDDDWTAGTACGTPLGGVLEASRTNEEKYREDCRLCMKKCGRATRQGDISASWGHNTTCVMGKGDTAVTRLMVMGSGAWRCRLAIWVLDPVGCLHSRAAVASDA